MVSRSAVFRSFRTLMIKMVSKSSFLLCSVILLFSAVIEICWAAEVYVNISVPQVKIGQDVTVNCIAHDIDKSTYITWMKKQGTTETPIGTNILINDNFKKTGRYSATVQEMYDAVVFTLKITGAQAEDGGSYGCYIPAQPNIKTYKPLTVLVPPNSIRLFSLAVGSDPSQAREYRNGERVRSYDGESRYFRCMVGPAIPAPTVTISYAGQNKSSLFKREEKKVVIGDEVADRGLVQHTTQVNLTTEAAPIKITYEANTQTVTCSASVPECEGVAISIKFLLQFAPRFDCGPVVRAGLYYDNISVACSVRADPPLHLTHTKWFWERNNVTNATLSYGEVNGRYTAKVIKGNLEDEHIVILSIDRTTPQVFRKYWLTVSNALGENTKEFLLEKDGSAPVKSAAGGTSMALVTLIALLFLFLCNHF